MILLAADGIPNAEIARLAGGVAADRNQVA
jgi:hypothetical protein